MTPLAWGRRLLMCPPRHFAVLYRINAWMEPEVAVDLDRAVEQWDALVATLRAAGAEVELLEPHPGVPDMVFTANAGLVNGTQFVPSRFRYPEREAEVPHYVHWFESHGFEVDELPHGVSHEGAGDALPFARVLLSGYRFRSDAASHAYVSTLAGVAVRSVELVDARLYHLDLTFCPLDDRHALVAPMGWDRYGRRVVEALVPEPIPVDDEDALRFCCNSVVVGSTIVMPYCPPALGRRLEGLGLDVAVCDVSEFQKAGGACRCLTLALDVTLGDPPLGGFPGAAPPLR